MITYLLQSSLALLLLIGVYHFLLRKNGFFRFNRFYLIASLLLSMIAPSLELQLNGMEQQEVIAYLDISQYTSTLEVLPSEAIGSPENATTSASIFNLIALIYLSVTSFFVIRFILNLSQLLSNHYQKGDRAEGMQLILLQRPTAPFSFFNLLFVAETEAEEIMNNRAVLLHEKAHAMQKHSIDVLFIEMMRMIFWFNPILILYRKAIQENHEFLADQYVINQPIQPQNYVLGMLQRLSSGMQHPLGSAFSYIQIKNRILMIQQNRQKNGKALFQLILSSGLACSILLICSFKSPQTTAIPSFEISPLVADNEPSILPIRSNEIKKITSEFGLRAHPFKKEKQMHEGIDIVAAKGTAILATADGVVVEAKYSEGFGHHIRIKHDATYTTMYAHLSKLDVEVGQKVKQAEKIGIIGTSGRSLGIHLHYEVIKNGEKIDPANFFEYSDSH